MEELLQQLVGTRVFMEYAKSDGTVTERIVKIVKIRDTRDKVVVWCEKRNALRTFNIRGVRSVLPLSSATKRVA